jgi:hypothetical protein
VLVKVVEAGQPAGAVHDQVLALLSELEARWSRLELGRMRELWDPGDPQPIYVAEELRHPVVGWEAFDEYWVRLSGRLRGARYRTGEVRVRSLTDDLALACFVIDWELLPVEASTPNQGQSRATAVLRRTGGGWRFVHYMEAPMHLGEEPWD